VSLSYPAGNSYVYAYLSLLAVCAENVLEIKR